MPATEDWKEIADSLEALALKLKMHYEQATEEPGEEAKNALESLGKAVEGAFDALRAAVKDPSVQDDVREAGVALRDALSNTFAEVTARLKR